MGKGYSKLRAPRLVFIDETAVTTKMVRHHGFFSR
jgi:hypothetical protein